ncbi:tripartite motif-containing protein 2-like [Ptychodera flava]|uniref:tripartite motif-containing protein 2-like n=1 Tax=Ptychodera flava TaxID=63121 RepID=UPI00396A6B48
MATAFTKTKLLEEIDEDFLCCSICLEQFKTPKILSCLHTFCQQCLITLVEKSGGSLICPECRQQHMVPDGGVPAIKGNFFVDNLIEKIQQLSVAVQEHDLMCTVCQEGKATLICEECTGKCHLCSNCAKVHQNLPATKTHSVLTIEEHKKIQTRPKALQAVDYCTVHLKNELKFFCETCKVPICSDCTIVKHRIPEHIHSDLTDAAEDYDRDMKAMVEKLKTKEREVESSETEAKELLSELSALRDTEVHRLRMKAENMIQQIREEEQNLAGQLQKSYEIKIKRASVAVDAVELQHGSIKSTCHYMETLMHHGSAAQRLSTKVDVEYRTQQLLAMENPKQEQQEKVVFHPHEIPPAHSILGVLKSDVCISQCSVQNVPKQLLKGDSVELLVITKDSDGNQVVPRQPVTAKVVYPDASSENITVKDNGDGTHGIMVEGQKDGKYQVSMAIGSQPIPGSLISIPVVKGLVRTIGRKGSGPGQFREPYSVAVNKDSDFVVADRNNGRLQITNREGSVRKIFKFQNFKGVYSPCDVTVTEDNLCFSLDDKNRQVVVSDENGIVIRCFGQEQLKTPQGLAVSPVNGNVYVTDCGGNCVRVYTQDGKYLKSFGSEGKGHAQFKWPWCITASNSGLVFIADSCNHRVQVFGTDDQYLYSFGNQNGEGQMKYPRGIALENDRHVYVSDNHHILKYNCDGKFVCRIDSDTDGLNCPTGLALTSDKPSRVVVADRENNRIKVFVQ